jgi:hypothetical protein
MLAFVIIGPFLSIHFQNKRTYISSLLALKRLMLVTKSKAGNNVCGNMAPPVSYRPGRTPFDEKSSQ